MIANILQAPGQQAFRSERRAASIAVLLFLCAGAADGMMLPFFPLWAHGVLHVPSAAIGVLFACYAGGEILAGPFLGGIADRIGRRRVLVVSTVGVGCGFLALGFAPNVWVAGVILLWTGISESVLHPTAQAVIGDVVPQERQRVWYSWVRVADGIGQTLGPALGALLALRSLDWVFAGAGCAGLLGALACVVWLVETGVPGHDAAEDEEEDGLSGLLPALRDPVLARLLLWFALFELSGNWIESVVPLFAHDRGLLSISGVGLLFAYAGALSVLGQVLLAMFGARIPAMALVLAAGVLGAIGFVGLAVSPGLAMVVASISLCAMGQMLTGPLVPVAINMLAPQGMRATYMAAASAANDLKDSLGPMLGTALYGVGARLPWIVGAPVVVVASCGLGIALRRAQAAMPSSKGTRLAADMERT